MLCGCTTTSIWSKDVPNSSCASMTSSPLFISVDESMVIFGPIDHVGWANASSIDTSARLAALRPRNGPPLAVSTTRDTSRSALTDERRHWWTAQCSLSTGTSSAPGVARSGCTTGPAAIRLSLLASANRLPAAQRGDGDRQAGEADDGVDHDVGIVGQVAQLGDHLSEGQARRRPGSLRRDRPRRPPSGGTRAPG